MAQKKPARATTAKATQTKAKAAPKAAKAVAATKARTSAKKPVASKAKSKSSTPAAAKTTRAPSAAAKSTKKPAVKKAAVKVPSKVTAKKAAAPKVSTKAKVPAKAKDAKSAANRAGSARRAAATAKSPRPSAARAAAKSVKTAKTAKAPVAKATSATARGSKGAAPKQAAARAVAASVTRSAGTKITAPVVGKSKSAPAATPKAIAEKAAAARRAALPKKPVNQRHGFKKDEQIVYPAHGVGRIIGIEEQEIAGMPLELFVIHFEKEKLTLRVPTGKSESVGMRKLADEPMVTKAMGILKGRARVKRTMWSRRAQEYVAKINSGNLISIAEVVRDLYRSDSQPEQSYSERQLYEDALDRMAREVAAVEKLDERGAVQRITEVLAKSARGRRAAEEKAEAEANGESAAA